VIYIDHFEMYLIFQKIFHWSGQRKTLQIVLKTKNIKTILPNYSAIASSDKFRSNHMKEKN
jgi:hypothetical protein